MGRSVAGSAVDNNKNRLAIGSDQRHPVHTAPRRIATSPLALSGHCAMCEVPPVPALRCMATFAGGRRSRPRPAFSKFESYQAALSSL